MAPRSQGPVSPHRMKLRLMWQTLFSMEYHSPRKDPDVESGHHKVRKGLFVLFVATNMGAPCAYKPPRSNLIDVGDSQPNEEEQHAEPLIENNNEVMTKQLGLLRTLEGFVKFVSKKSMLVIGRMTS
ncbi:uncharacterized protein [Zea mays]|uniref:uncharacterized protein n=1 Tax=Zea mays TaxID=4577 RepID=UPI000221A81B|nr:uncharacterized protein LOC103649680 [Zea mays]|eukprot:XP_020406253.1 uncharacterized protein LOC103649680 [Zea mays]